MLLLLFEILLTAVPSLDQID